jgi:hypothetical protein
MWSHFYLMTKDNKPTGSWPTVSEELLKPDRPKTEPFESSYLGWSIEALCKEYKTLFKGGPFSMFTFVVLDERTVED